MVCSSNCPQAETGDECEVLSVTLEEEDSLGPSPLQEDSRIKQESVVWSVLCQKDHKGGIKATHK